MAGMLDRALALAAEGFVIFPLSARGKNPLIKWSQGSSSDPERIRQWWTRWPEANVGVDCGKSGLLVIDVDVKDDKPGLASLAAVQEANAPLPATRQARTASGGFHIIFKGAVGNSVQKLGPGLDIRSVGGFIVGVGSCVPKGEYTWLEDEFGPLEILEAPEWLVTLCGQPREASSNRQYTPEGGWDQVEDIEWARAVLAKATPAKQGDGGDVRTFALVAELRDHGLSQDTALDLLLELWNPRCEPPWSQEELTTKVENAYKYAKNDAGVHSVASDFEPVEGAEDGDGDSETAEEFGSNGDDTNYVGFFDQWVWVAGIKQFVNRERPDIRLDKEQFDSIFNYLVEGGKLSDRIFKGKRTLRKFFNVCYRPGQPEFCEKHYNLFRPSTLVPVKDADVSLFMQHMELLVPDPVERGHVLDFCAFIVQHPGKKMSYALLMQGGEGIGKSFLGRLFGAILGEHNVGRPSNSDLAEQFNGWAAAKQLIVIEELMALQRRETANKLKPLITDMTVSIREMYRPPYQIENCANFIMFTNHRDAIPLDAGDRRYMVIFSPMAPQTPDYYARLWDWLGANDGSWGGAAKIAGWLATRDLSQMTPKGHAPATDAKELMRRETMHEAHAYLLEQLEMGEGPFRQDLVSVEDLVDGLPERLVRKAPRLPNIISNFLRVDAKAVRLGQRRVAGGRARKVLWCLRRHEIIGGLNEAEQGRLYDAQTDGFQDDVFGPRKTA